MAYWLLKTEPGDYSYDDLVRDKRTRWSGVTNPVALKHMRSARKGDLAMIYHTGDEKQIVGIAELAGEPYADPDADDERIVAFDIKPRRKLERPVTLAAVKADPMFKNFELVRISRLSVMPVDPQTWEALLRMGGSS